MCVLDFSILFRIKHRFSAGLSTGLPTRPALGGARSIAVERKISGVSRSIILIARRGVPRISAPARRRFAREPRTGPRNDDTGVACAMLPHDAKQGRGIGGVKPDAAMRGGAAKPGNLVAAMDRIAALEEDRVRHRRIIVLAGEPSSLQPGGGICSVRRAVAGAPRRNRPVVPRRAVDRDGHSLGALVYRDDDSGIGARGQAGKQSKSGGAEHDESMRRGHRDAFRVGVGRIHGRFQKIITGLWRVQR